MKKILLSICMAACGLTAMAKDYTDKLIVTINDVSTPEQETTIGVEINEDNNLDISLLNFTLDAGGGNFMYVGHIYVNDVELTEGADYDSFSVSQTIRIPEGDNDSLQWIGPLLQDVPIEMTGKISDNKFYCTINIEMVMLGQTIHVMFGTDDFPSAVLSAKADDPDKLVDVYTILGTKAKSQVRKSQALEGLPRGIYIVDGRKVTKK